MSECNAKLLPSSENFDVLLTSYSAAIFKSREKFPYLYTLAINTEVMLDYYYDLAGFKAERAIGNGVSTSV